MLLTTERKIITVGLYIHTHIHTYTQMTIAFLILYLNMGKRSIYMRHPRKSKFFSFKNFFFLIMKYNKLHQITLK